MKEVQGVSNNDWAKKVHNYFTYRYNEDQLRDLNQKNELEKKISLYMDILGVPKKVQFGVMRKLWKLFRDYNSSIL